MVSGNDGVRSSMDDESQRTSDHDGLFVQAARLVVQEQRCGFSRLRKRLNVSCRTVVKVQSWLEQRKVISPQRGKRRTVLVKSEAELDRLLASLAHREGDQPLTAVATSILVAPPASVSPAAVVGAADRAGTAVSLVSDLRAHADLLDQLFGVPGVTHQGIMQTRLRQAADLILELIAGLPVLQRLDEAARLLQRLHELLQASPSLPSAGDTTVR